jgi:hypothetical protein
MRIHVTLMAEAPHRKEHSMPDQSTTTPLHMRVITSPGTRAIVALAAGLIAGAALAHEQPGGGTAAGPDSSGSAAAASTSANTGNTSTGTGTSDADPATPAQQPINEQGISGELFHALLGLSMQNADYSGFPDEVITGYPADSSTWKKQDNPAPELPNIAAYQYYTDANDNGSPKNERTADGNFFLAQSNFFYHLNTGMKGSNSGSASEVFLDSSATIPVQVTDEGITLANTMKLEQETASQGPKTYELKADAPKGVSKMDFITFDTFVQSYKGTDNTNSGSYSVQVKKGDNPQQAKLCWYDSVGSVSRTVCQVWSVPGDWTFGKALNYDRTEVDDMRGYLPPTDFNPGARSFYWVTGPQTWPRL